MVIREPMHVFGLWGKPRIHSCSSLHPSRLGQDTALGNRFQLPHLHSSEMISNGVRLAKCSLHQKEVVSVRSQLVWGR